MKCQHVQQRLLATSGPRRLADEVQAHLDGCERCRTWSERLQQIDEAVPQLPVPDASRAKARLMHHFLTPRQPAVDPVWAPRRLRVNWARVAVVTAAAVVVVLAIGGVFNLEKRPTVVPAQDTLLAKVIERQMELARAETVEKRVEVLDQLAGDLGSETLNLARVAEKDDLSALADMYVSVISGDHGLVSRADELPQDKRKKLLEPIAERLKKVSEKAAETSREVPPDAVKSLTRVAAKAREAQDAIRRKINEEKMAQDGSPQRGESKS